MWRQNLTEKISKCKLIQRFCLSRLQYCSVVNLQKKWTFYIERQNFLEIWNYLQAVQILHRRAEWSLPRFLKQLNWGLDQQQPHLAHWKQRLQILINTLAVLYLIDKKLTINT